MRTYKVVLTGRTPLLMHPDNLDWADEMEAWKNDPANKAASKAGDDRTPAFRWIGNLYHDGAVVAVPSDNLMRCAMEGGAMVPVPGGRRGKTFKAQSQSGMAIGEAFWPLAVNGVTMPIGPINALMAEKSFKAHRDAVSGMGFSLFTKRARIGTAKHVRVRPRFDVWGASGTVSVWDDAITTAVLQDIFSYAGRYKGLCDWRPGSKTPGSFGMFDAIVKEA